jgi:osmotically-inducible protein OsmY
VAANEAVKKVKGVKAVAEDIEVKYGTNYQKTDKEIAKAIISAFEWNTSIPEDKIAVEVSNGWVNLSGEVEYPYQKEAIKRVTASILGVKGINNTIQIAASVEPVEVKENISRAFKRSATLKAEQIKVEIFEDTVKLTGQVHSLSEKRSAQKIAYFTPAVYKVKNELAIID